MRASSAVIKSFQTFILLHSFLRQMCIGKVSWEFGRRVKSSVKVFLKETNTRNSKETDQLKTEGGSRSTTALRRIRLAGTDSSTAALDQTKSAREKIPLFFATDLEDGSRKLGPLLSYTYSPPKELMAAGREPQTENASSMQEEIKHPDELTEPSVTNGIRPPTSIPGQNITDSLLKGDIPYMKVTCPLTEMKTPASSMQKVTIRFTYEVDTKNTSFVVSDIESMMFQSVVATLLDCGKTRQLLRNMRGRRKVKEDGVEKTLQFLAIDSIPGDTLRANETCTALIGGSTCHIVDGSLTVEINQAGEEAARNAEFKVLQLLSGLIKYGTFNSAENGITATRYISPDLAALSSMVSTISASVVPSSSSHQTAILFSSIGVGLLVIALIATHHIRRQRDQWQPLSNGEVASGDPNKLECTQSDSDFVSTVDENPEGLMQHPEGYTVLAEDDTAHVPPGVCFDEGFLVSPSKLDAISERDEDIQESSTTGSCIQKPSEF